MARRKVLFVDDNMMDRMILSKILDELDVDYFDTKTPEEFLKKLKEVEPDICLIDLNIRQPNDGYLLVKAIRNIIGRSLPVIVISASEKSELIKTNLEVGADDFICKPIDKALLSSKISNYCKTRKINSFVLPLFNVPDTDKSKMKINFKCVVESVSENGLVFKSSHLIKSRTRIKLADPFMFELFNEHGAVAAIVTESWESEDNNTRHFKVEFDGLTLVQRQNLRKYITKEQHK